MTQAARTSAPTPQTAPVTTSSALAALGEQVRPWLEAMGYELVHLEALHHPQRTLRILIDRLDTAPEGGNDGGHEGGITLEDCTRVSHAIDEKLDALTDAEQPFKGASYDLEVSSPGVDRPLRTEKDYLRFIGKRVRVQMYRPLEPRESGNPEFVARYPKLKLLVGELKAFDANRAVLEVSPARDGMEKKTVRKLKATAGGAKFTTFEVGVPVELIAKANLEPEFDLELE